MGFPSYTIRLLKLVPLTIANLNLAQLIQTIFIEVLKRVYLSEKETDLAVENRPHPSLVPLPVHFTVGPIKERLPIVEFGCILERFGGCKVNSICAVCLKCMKASDEVRELSNCCHVYHRECIDGWIDQGQITCPLCRSKVCSDHGEKSTCGGDPWRRERMIYLFGEDCLMGTS